jgi:predicted ATPase
VEVTEKCKCFASTTPDAYHGRDWILKMVRPEEGERPMRVTHLSVEGYRSLVDVSVPLRALNVMIGPNGCGKTSILEIIQLLRDAMQERLADSLEQRGGLNAVVSRVTNGSQRLRISLQVDAESPRSDAPLCYRFELSPRDIGYVVPHERLEWHFDPSIDRPFYYIDAHYDEVRYTNPEMTGFARPTWEYNSAELALAQVPRLYEEPEALRRALSSTRLFSYLDVGPRSVVRLPQGLTPAKTPGPNGESLFSALHNLRALHRTSIYARIEEVLGLAFPDFLGLEFPAVGAGQVTMTWYQAGLAGPLYPGELSEGTLRFLWLVTVLLAPDPSPITLIDEPEVSLHPKLLKLLANLLQDASTRGQLVVATHSADLVRWLEPQEVLVFEKTEGRTRCTWADSLDLGGWLKDFTLAELWQMGTLGDWS